MPTRPFDQPFTIFIGPQRAGTSWLDLYLRARGDIALPTDVKELFFFDRYFDFGADHYFTHFKPEPRHAAVCEITTTSFDHREAPSRMHRFLGGDITLICPLRHPIRRSYSLYQHYRRYGMVQGSLMEACDALPQIITSSFYADHLTRWFDMFGRNHITLVYQEQLEQDRDAYIRHICQAMRIPFRPAPDDLKDRVNAATVPRSAWLARLAQAGGDWLRRYRFYSVINLAKSMGLKNFIFGSDRRPVRDKGGRMTEHEKNYLEDRLGGEIEKLEQLLDEQLPQWRTNPIIS